MAPDSREIIALRFPASPSDKRSMKMKIGLEHRWNNNDSGRPNYEKKKKSMSQCHSVNHKSHMDLAWDGTRASTVRGCRLIVSVITALS